MMKRREFLKGFGMAAAAVQMVSLDQASAALPAEPFLHEDGLVSPSSDWLLVPHQHLLVVPFEALENPPALGIELRTSYKLAHTHKVILSRAQLMAIAQGETVIVRDATVNEHSFILQLPGGLAGLPD